MSELEKLIPQHWGYRRLKRFQVAQLASDHRAAKESTVRSLQPALPRRKGLEFAADLIHGENRSGERSAMPQCGFFRHEQPDGKMKRC